MDTRRLSTGDLMGIGILGIPAPTTDIPKDREEVDAEYKASAEVAAVVESGKLASFSGYYGLPYVWKQSDGVYRGILLQYREVTESPTFASADEAAEWFVAIRAGVDG